MHQELRAGARRRKCGARTYLLLAGLAIFALLQLGFFNAGFQLPQSRKLQHDTPLTSHRRSLNTQTKGSVDASLHDTMQHTSIAGVTSVQAAGFQQADVQITSGSISGEAVASKQAGVQSPCRDTMQQGSCTNM